MLAVCRFMSVKMTEFVSRDINGIHYIDVTEYSEVLSEGVASDSEHATETSRIGTTKHLIIG